MRALWQESTTILDQNPQLNPQKYITTSCTQPPYWPPFSIFGIRCPLLRLHFIRESNQSLTSVVVQQQRRLPPAALLPLAYRYLLPLAIPSVLGKRGGIYKQDLGSSILLHYRVFQVRIPELRFPKGTEVFLGE